MTFQRIMSFVFRLFAGGIFIWAAIQKIQVPCELAMDIYHYQLAPAYVINLVAIVLPYIEFILGIALILGIAPRGAALGISVILIFFIVLLSINLVRGLNFDCGCFGSAETDWCQIFGKWFQRNHPDLAPTTLARVRIGCDVVRDIIFLFFSVGAYVLSNPRNKSR